MPAGGEGGAATPAGGASGSVGVGGAVGSAGGSVGVAGWHEWFTTSASTATTLLCSGEPTGTSNRLDHSAQGGIRAAEPSCTTKAIADPGFATCVVQIDRRSVESDAFDPDPTAGACQCGKPRNEDPPARSPPVALPSHAARE